MINDIMKGVKAYFGALTLISKLKLWKFFAIPILISVVTATVIFGSAYLLSDNIGGYLSSFWKWDFGKGIFDVITRLIGGLGIIVIGLILYKHIVLALVSPFMGEVSEKIEIHFKGKQHQHRETSFREQLMRGIKISLRNISRELLFTLPLVLLSFIPVIGLLFTFASFLIQAYYAGFGNIDFTLERHYDYKKSISFVKENKGLAVGNGIVFMLFLLIPFIGVILVLPLSVTAATKEVIEKI